LSNNLILSNLSVFYRNKSVIDKINLEIPLHQWVVIAGNNGSGKTSLFKAITGKISYSGEIHVVNEKSKHEVNVTPHYFSYLEQNTPFQVPFTVSELVVMGTYHKKPRFSHYTKEDYSLAEEFISLFEITHLKHKIFSELSGGEQILVWLAQILLMDSEIILLDEPTRHLDTYYTNLVLGIFYRLVEEKKKSIILITHDLNSLKGYKGRLINLSSKPVVLEELNEGSIARNMEKLKEKG